MNVLNSYVGKYAYRVILLVVLRKIMWCIDPLLRGDFVNISRCYEAPAAYACAMTSHKKEVMQEVFSVGPFLGYVPRLTVFCRACECSAVEGLVVES
jgi:hypothetical protein